MHSYLLMHSYFYELNCHNQYKNVNEQQQKPTNKEPEYESSPEKNPQSSYTSLLQLTFLPRQLRLWRRRRGVGGRRREQSSRGEAGYGVCT